MRIIDHHIVGHQGGGGGRTSDVFDPNTGRVQASVALGTAAAGFFAVIEPDALRGFAAAALGLKS